LRHRRGCGACFPDLQACAGPLAAAAMTNAAIKSIITPKPARICGAVRVALSVTR